MNPDEVLNAVDPEWNVEARRLMEAHRGFAVLNFGFPNDESEAYKLALELNYRLHFDTEHRRAEFWPNR